MAGGTERAPRFRASRDEACGSDYACEGIELGARVATVDTAAGPVRMCEPCADRTEAAAELDATTARSLAEVVEALRTAPRASTGDYQTALVDALLDQLDAGADEVAAFERERWARWFRHTAHNGRHLAEELRAGMRYAARQLDLNTARFTREGTPTS